MLQTIAVPANGVQADDFIEFWRRLREEPTYVILGVQGSGTNLLLRILRNCFRVSVVRDRSLIVGAASALVADSSPGAIARAKSRVVSSLFPSALRKRLLPRAYYRQSKEYEGIEKWLDQAEIRTPADFCDFFYSYQCFKTGGLHKGVKSDDIWQYAGDLDQTIPQRRIVRLVRDPRDNALSITNKGWGPVHPYVAARFVRDQSQIYDSLCDRSPSETIVLKYEQLLATPLAVVEQFAAFSGLQPVVDLTAAIERLKIRSSNREKWRSLPPRILAACDDVLREQIVKYGYALQSSAPVSLSRRIRYRLSDIAHRIPQKATGLISRRLIHGYGR